jgi:glycosyltransferase involved in cell wall biosynthesis
MKIALVGGVYGKDESYRTRLQVTPETLLEQGFIAGGQEVSTFSHYAPINADQFDVIHVHHLSYGSVRAATDTTEAAFAYTSHDPLAMSRMLGWPRRIAARFVASRADAVVALSKAEADFQRRNYQLAGAIHTVIPNGIDSRNYAYVRTNAAGIGRPWQLLYVGQLIAMKNVDVLLRAVARIRQPIEVQLVYHNSSLEIPLRRLAFELGLSERVFFLGSKSPRELAALYQRADLFVLPSAGEALPSVVTEAMLCGTPVIASDVGGIREQLCGYGVCVPPGRPDELATAISYVLDHYEIFAARSGAASTYAREQFSIKNMIDRHLELYATLLDCKGPRRRHAALKVPLNSVLKMGVSLRCAMKRRTRPQALPSNTAPQELRR